MHAYGLAWAGILSASPGAAWHGGDGVSHLTTWLVLRPLADAHTHSVMVLKIFASAAYSRGFTSWCVSTAHPSGSTQHHTARITRQSAVVRCEREREGRTAWTARYICTADCALRASMGLADVKHERMHAMMDSGRVNACRV